MSTQQAAYRLGMQVITMNADQGWKIEFEDGAIMNADKAEHVREAAAVMSQMVDIIAIRSFPAWQTETGITVRRLCTSFQSTRLYRS